MHLYVIAFFKTITLLSKIWGKNGDNILKDRLEKSKSKPQSFFFFLQTNKVNNQLKVLLTYLCQKNNKWI